MFPFKRRYKGIRHIGICRGIERYIYHDGDGDDDDDDEMSTCPIN